jgi:hypothetical protein
MEARQMDVTGSQKCAEHLLDMMQWLVAHERQIVKKALEAAYVSGQADLLKDENDRLKKALEEMK